MKDAPVTWLYALLRADKRPALGRLPRGPSGCAAPRLVDAGGGLWLLVSDAPLDVFGDAPLNARLSDLDWVSACALAHEAVVTSARAKARALAPMKLFTLFRSEARALQFVDRDRRRLLRVLERVEGCAEYGVRLLWDQAKAKARAEAQVHRAGAGAKGGAGFLARKSQLRQVASALDEGARTAAAALFEELEALAESARRRAEVEGLAEGSRLLMDGVFLVKESRGARFGARLKSAARALEREGYSLSVSGPWPPYHFVVDAA
jgi:hypothetical protein